MKALRIPTITLLLSLFIAGIRSQAETKKPVSAFQYNFPSALTQLKTTLSQEMQEINEIKESVGRSSSKAENLLSKCVKVISYLEELLEVSPASTLKCLIPGAKPDPKRGVCYLLVTNPKLHWSEAERYCDDLKGDLIAPLPLDITLGTDLVSLFPELATFNGHLWVDGRASGSGAPFVYENDFVYPLSATTVNHHLAMVLPPTSTPSIVQIDDDDADDRHKFICQLDAVPVLPPFKMAQVDDEDDTHIPDKKYLVDVESVNDVYHHSGENSDGYGHPNEAYYHSGENGDGGYGHLNKEYHKEGLPENPENPELKLARQINPKIIL